MGSHDDTKMAIYTALEQINLSFCVNIKTVVKRFRLAPVALQNLLRYRFRILNEVYKQVKWLQIFAKFYFVLNWNAKTAN